MIRRLARAVRRVFRGPSPDDPIRDFTATQRQLIDRVRPYTMTSGERIVHLAAAIEYVERANIPGAIVECGVWRGGSMMAVAYALQGLHSTNRDLYMFDTFEGMTQAGAEDVSVHGHDARAWLAERPRTRTDLIWAYAPLEEVQDNLRRTGYPAEKLHFVQGPVEQTLPSAAPTQIAVLRLDTDWYESTKHELETLYDRLSPGGVLIIDDYGFWRGARRAVDEFFENHGPCPLLFRVDAEARSCVKPHRSE